MFLPTESLLKFDQGDMVSKLGGYELVVLSIIHLQLVFQYNSRIIKKASKFH